MLRPRLADAADLYSLMSVLDDDGQRFYRPFLDQQDSRFVVSSAPALRVGANNSSTRAGDLAEAHNFCRGARTRCGPRRNGQQMGSHISAAISRRAPVHRIAR